MNRDQATPTPSSTYLDKLQELERCVVSAKASLSAAERRQILERARSGAQQHRADSSLPQWIVSLTDEVVHDPINADVDGHLKQGKTEAEIFEVVTVAAVGVALALAGRVLPALRTKP